MESILNIIQYIAGIWIVSMILSFILGNMVDTYTKKHGGHEGSFWGCIGPIVSLIFGPLVTLYIISEYFEIKGAVKRELERDAELENGVRQYNKSAEKQIKDWTATGGQVIGERWNDLFRIEEFPPHIASVTPLLATVIIRVHFTWVRR